MNKPDPVRSARRRTLIAWSVLIGLLALWWLSGLSWPPDAGDALAGLLILPLALTLPGLSRDSRSACAAATLLLIPYMGWGVTELVANPPARLFAGATVLSAMACFVVLVYRLRILRSA